MAVALRLKALEVALTITDWLAVLLNAGAAEEVVSDVFAADAMSAEKRDSLLEPPHFSDATPMPISLCLSPVEGSIPAQSVEQALSAVKPANGKVAPHMHCSPASVPYTLYP